MGDTDISEVDLAATVTIGNKFVEVYPDAKEGFAEPGEKPARGEKLNKEAIITLKADFSRKGESES